MMQSWGGRGKGGNGAVQQPATAANMHHDHKQCRFKVVSQMIVTSWDAACAGVGGSSLQRQHKFTMIASNHDRNKCSQIRQSDLGMLSEEALRHSSRHSKHDTFYWKMSALDININKHPVELACTNPGTLSALNKEQSSLSRKHTCFARYRS